MTKNFIPHARRRLILRADIFSFINRADYSIPTRYLGTLAFGQAVSTNNPPRRVQFALKYSF